ncbi:MAG: hypothetical protein IKA19_06380 [Muribaculaceae bacterium]|nr:hypothetical protein [Muribaculaceae bacterium]
MAKLTITLRQDTPMWHFLPDETGCCLRATEVKPKLDKFLKTKPGYKSEWQIKDKDQDALDYKMSFCTVGEINEKIKDSKFSLFFGNQKKPEDEQKKPIYYPNGIVMTIFSLNSDLVEKIKDHICEFFACHSFGTRQSKGFGCFYPTKINNNDIKPKNYCSEKIKSIAQYKFETAQINDDDFKKLFEYINCFHKLIRSGINNNRYYYDKKKGKDIDQKGSYYKSLMYFYVKEELKTDWDKPRIRHRFKLWPQTPSKRCDALEFKTMSDKPITLYRDALGLSYNQMWGSGRNVNIEIDDVERFKSPIFYRPVWNGSRYIVYIILDTSIKIDNRTGKIIYDKDKEKESENVKIAPFDVLKYFEYIENKIKFVSNGSKDTTPNVDAIIKQIKGSFEKI